MSSVEALLSPSELTEIRREIDRALHGRRAEFAVATRTRSVHAIEGATVQRAKDVYEPRGRLEFDELPTGIAQFMERITLGRMPDIRRTFPSVRRSMDWFYVEYGPGQFVTPHVDYPFNGMDPARPKIAAIGVTLDAPTDGGEFFVDTSADPALWTDDRSTIRSGANEHSDWFRRTERSRWRVLAAPGDALCWGTELVHGTEPVRAGVAAKLIAFLAA